MKFLLNTGRTIKQGSYVERKNSTAYRQEATSLHMHPVDMMDLEIEEESHVRVESDYGVVVMKVYPALWISQGEVFVCLGPYANHLVSPETHCTGMPDFKGMIVQITPTTEPLVTVAALMEQCGGIQYED
ncbi:MAG: molybdopterin dinucleotide-binding protein [Methanoregulaceae archaeon]|jgi:formylmethanofuran dehydrogenase subunit D|nr:molybdopterin dinucleotide-binding protein [Methanoregulaceae archaeon]MCU0628561.1 molybdopterin dinucleotide-binding protein [Methanoregulaceae archaeon]